ncbi:hypothetical protein [Desulfobacula sp.]|uniref:hypothetical protein n=1 Tax=Desulfobacula sp. TaxID=2593537 RepID=UPI0025C0CEAF|nr:hypothetical protein [Desulfobacula sp.]MBC2706094.1 hypothetical protein [Desulfobacula sp.]
MRNMLIVCLLFFTSTAIAATDIVATYKYQDGSMVTIVTRDSRHVRMDTSATSYLLLQEDKVFSVSQDDSGQWMVMDMGQMKTAGSGGLTSLFGGGGETKAEEEYSATYEKTGQKEKISGYTGVVYNMELLEGDNVVRRDEVVLSSHSDLKKVNEGWSAMAAKMGENMGEEMAKSLEKATKEAKEAGYGGMLRYGDEMKLYSLKKMSLDVSYYQVPPGAQYVEMGQMPDFGQQPNYDQQQQSEQQQQVYEQQQQQQEQQSQAGQVLEQDAKDVGQAARQETKDATVDEVKEGVRSLFKSIFD